MTQGTIHFRSLLDRLLPLEALIPPPRDRSRPVLRDSLAIEVERPGRHTIERLRPGRTALSVTARRRQRRSRWRRL